MEYYALIENVDGGLHEQSYNIMGDINQGLSPTITELMHSVTQEENKYNRTGL